MGPEDPLDVYTPEKRKSFQMPPEGGSENPVNQVHPRKENQTKPPFQMAILLKNKKIFSNAP